jgi:hypothetical protein
VPDKAGSGSCAAPSPTRVLGSEPEGDGVELAHDSLMGAILVLAGVLTFLYTRDPSNRMKILALLGAAGTVIIGALVFFQLA